MMFKFFLIFAILRIAAACVRQFLNENTLRDSLYCSSFECHHAAKIYHNSINYFVEPCDDFYEFVCSGWKNMHFIKPSKKSLWNNYEAIHFSVLGQLHQSLEYLHRPNRKIEWEVIDLYKGCMNEIKREHLQVEPLREILKKIGGWPIIGDEFDENSYDWLGTLAWMSKNIGISNVIFQVNINSNPKCPYNALCFDIPINLVKVNLRKEESIKFSEIFRMVSEFNTTIGPNVLQEIIEVLELQEKLNNLAMEKLFQPFVPVITIRNVQDLQEAFGNKINISSYMQKILEGIIEVTKETVINALPSRNYIIQLSQLMENTNKRVIANFIGWKVMERLSSLTISEFRQNTIQIVESPLGSEKDMPLHEHCIKITERLLPHALGSIYVKDHFLDDYVKDLHEMVSLVKNSFHDIIEHSDWMDAQTRETAILKLESMRQVIGYADWILNDKTLDKYYKKLGHIDEDHFFQSALNVLQFNRNKELMQVISSVDEFTSWVHSPIEINAYYNPGINGLFLAAAIIQWPFYMNGLPIYINLGGFGTIIGHEMTHGFGIDGYMYDETGHIRDWWVIETRQKFINKSQCFVSQYEGYEPVKGFKVRGHQTLEENIADNGGVREAFRAWKRYEKRQEGYHDKRLPILEFTKDQLFFIAYAFAWCSNDNSTALVNKIETDKHSPEKVRVIGALSNNRDFHKAFNCSKGDRMYREDPCIIW